MNARLINQKNGFKKGIEIFLSANSLNHGSDNVTSNNESIKAKITTKNDSLKNCCINCLFKEPIALRIPTSLARFSARAVLKLMKLIQANSSTKIPTIPKSHTNVMRPPSGSPFLKSEYKCQSFIGYNKAWYLYSCIPVATSFGTML